MAKIKNLVLDQGTTFQEFIIYTDAAKTPIDISGFSARAQMRRAYTSANAITFTANVVASANGNISLNLSAAETANIKSGRYVYDVEIYDSSNVVIVHRVIEGIITVNPEVTK